MGTPERRARRGFTLLELMIAVVVISILAALVIPSFMTDSRKSKAKTEVSAFFGELSTKEEQYKVDNNTYYPNPAGTTAICPGASTGAAQSMSPCIASGGQWDGLRVLPPTTSAICSYTITSGSASDVPSPPAGFAMGGTPVASWYFIVAGCDMNPSSAIHSSYFMSSLDSTLQIQNEGQ